MILDVGCGSKARGDVNVDLLVPDSLRGWNRNISAIKNFVKADVRALPFKDRSFDFVFCSHVIEHLDDEWEGINELKRVSRKYVAVVVPFVLFAPIVDLIYHGWGYAQYLRWLRIHHKHNWLVNPFKAESFKLLGAPQVSNLWKRKNKIKAILSRLPVPIQSLSMWDVENE